MTATADRASFGGEMELAPELLDQAQAAAMPAWPVADVATVATGRTALCLAADVTVSRGGPRRILLPAYLCATMLRPFQDRGFEIGFYRVKPDLSLDVTDLVRQAESGPWGAVLFIDYFGFPLDPAARTVLSQLRGGCLLIEDCAHGSLLESECPAVGDLGDLVLTSLRKYLPVPDGGLLLSMRPDLAIPRLEPATAPWVDDRLHAKRLRYDYLHGPRPESRAEQTYLELLARAEAMLDQEPPMAAMSTVSRRLMGQLSPAAAMVRRRTNFQLLLETFQADPALRAVATPLFPALPSRVSPLAFPVRVRGDRDRLRARLRELGVFCPVHWDLRHEPWITAFPQSRDLAATELSIPIDQRYQADDIVELARRLRLAGLESSLPGRQAWTADTTQGAGLP